MTNINGLAGQWQNYSQARNYRQAAFDGGYYPVAPLLFNIYMVGKGCPINPGAAEECATIDAKHDYGSRCANLAAPDLKYFEFSATNFRNTAVP